MNRQYPPVPTWNLFICLLIGRLHFPSTQLTHTHPAQYQSHASHRFYYRQKIQQREEKKHTIHLHGFTMDPTKFQILSHQHYFQLFCILLRNSFNRFSRVNICIQFESIVCLESGQCKQMFTIRFVTINQLSNKMIAQIITLCRKLALAKLFNCYWYV